MTLTLSLRGIARLDNGAPTELVLNRRGAVVGRAPTCDWPLPDPAKHVSSRHFQIDFDGSKYVLEDISTNGTFLNGASARMAAPRTIEQGDSFQVGPFAIEARLSGEAAMSPPTQDSSDATGAAWAGWQPRGTPVDGFLDDRAQGSASGSTGSSDGWGAAPPYSANSEQPAVPAAGPGWAPPSGPPLARLEAHRSAGAQSAGGAARPAASDWASSAAAPAPAPVQSSWDAAKPQPEPASGWSSAAPDRPAPASPDDVWGRLAEGNVVDWARGGFGQPAEAKSDPLGLNREPAQASLPANAPGQASAEQASPQQPLQTPPSSVPPAQQFRSTTNPSLSLDTASGSAYNSASGSVTGSATHPPLSASEPAIPTMPPPSTVRAPSDEGRIADALLVKMVAGLVIMLESRARAKAQMGAEATAFNPHGHNPLKFARTPDEALAMLLEPPQRGFMEAEPAIEDAFKDLQSHQMATLRAMQGALRATLERFSPTAIRERANERGLFERILPGARDAALWQAYEKEFSGVAQGSDEAFMDVFSKEFRSAYNAVADNKQ